ncbi:MAG: LPS export ABC transporter permease LptF [Gammaproteobacteria bacterium]|nr:LPS export ABC transporter permease LptF [Gammaproteobacteria bacterium]
MPGVHACPNPHQEVRAEFRGEIRRAAARMIIHRAFIREVLRACGAVGAVLLAIFLLARLMGFLRQAVEGDIPAGGVFLLLFLKTITYLDILAPLALYVAALLVMARWVRDNELAALSACGVGVSGFIKPAAALFALVGALDAAFALYLSPLSAQASRVITHELRARAETAGVVAGVFHETADRERVYFVERREEGGGFGGVFIYDGGGEEEVVVVAETGQIRGGESEVGGGDFLVLQNGARYQGAAGSKEFAALEFETYGVRLKARARGGRDLPVKAMPTWQLLRQNDRAAAGEFHWRLSKVFMLPVLLIFALAFSSLDRRKKRFPGMLAALLVYFAYSNFLGFALALIRRGAANPHWTLWAVHLLFLVLALHFLRNRNRNLPLLALR